MILLGTGTALALWCKNAPFDPVNAFSHGTHIYRCGAASSGAYLPQPPVPPQARQLQGGGCLQVAMAVTGAELDLKHARRGFAMAVLLMTFDLTFAGRATDCGRAPTTAL